MDDNSLLSIIIGIVSFVLLSIILFYVTLRYTYKVFDTRLSEQEAKKMRNPVNYLVTAAIIGFCLIIAYSYEIAAYINSLD